MGFGNDVLKQTLGCAWQVWMNVQVEPLPTTEPKDKSMYSLS
jgi:hypothetical protein